MRRTASPAAARRRRRAAPILLALALAACSEEASPRLELASDVERCRENLSAIHQGLVDYTRQVGHPPRASGVGLLAELLTSGVWEDTPESRARLTCPGPNAELAPPDTDFLKVDRLSDASSAYAARDMRSHPFASYPAGGSELGAVVACDNVGGTMNHDGVLNVLYSDGSIRTFVLAEMIDAGRLPVGTEVVVAGPDSTIADLRVLTLD